MDDEIREQIRDSYRRAIEHVENTIQSERHMIEMNRQMAASHPADGDHHLRHVREGEGRIAELELELHELEERRPLT